MWLLPAEIFRRKMCYCKYNMKIYGSKLIVLRGNSGAGKSTVAKALREDTGRKVAIVEQDYLRRNILHEKVELGTDTMELIEQTVAFALSRKYDVILDGILPFTEYGGMLERLLRQCPDHHIYYFDTSLEETIRRHAAKTEAQDFGEEELRKWYRKADYTRFDGERIIPETSTIDQTVRLLIKETGLVR